MNKMMLYMDSVTKSFPGVLALDNVDLQVKKGEIHALVGENGAGKSTLMNVLSGNYPFGTYSGDIIYKGEKKRFHTIKDSEVCGIAIIFQELALAPQLSVCENLFLGNEIAKNGLIDWDRSYKEALKALKRVGLDISPDTIISDLGVGQQQLVEIAKALYKNAELLILDEPSASLTEHEIDVLLDILNELRKQGVTCIYISHKFNEIFQIADSVTILRDGATVESGAISQYVEKTLISRMVGRKVEDIYPTRSCTPGEEFFHVKNWSAVEWDNPERYLVKDSSFSLRKGEILGLAGLMGAGRTELAMSLIAARGKCVSGTIILEGKELTIRNPGDAIRNRISYLSEDRKSLGLNLGMTVMENITLASLGACSNKGMINPNDEIQMAEKYKNDLRIKTSDINQKVINLSGGNQQKVALSKWLMTEPQVLILDEPTRGIDVGAKNEIYKLINQLSAEGYGILVISSELTELLGICDRIMVMSEGSITGILDSKEATQEEIMALATRGRNK